MIGVSAWRTALPKVWGATPSELAAFYPADDLAAGDERLVRAVGSAAPAADVYRWLCQLRVAPYSYDWIDNAGRRSPRQLIEGMDDLAVGQRFMTIFHLLAFCPGSEITLSVREGLARALFGPVVVTYRVGDLDQGCRLVAVLRVGGRSGPLGRVRRRALAWGDLVMMRKQLLTLAALAARAPAVP